MKRVFLPFLVTVPILAASCKTSGQSAVPSRPGTTAESEPVTEKTFENPVLKDSAADPTVLDNRERDGYFYMYSTNAGGKTMPVYRSKDLVNWTLFGDGFSSTGKPSWQPGAGLWAPDINYINGKYVLYYAMGVWGDHEKSASGVATANYPTGYFKDNGMIVSYASHGVLNSIDPNYFEDTDGQKYLFWGSLGSGSGIWGIRLSEDGYQTVGTPVKLTLTSMEGAYVHKRGKYYYLFASEGSCCEGAKSTYHIVVGRSENPLGPYADKNGVSMKTGSSKRTILSGDGDYFIGPGHNAEIITDKNGDDWMLFHTYYAGDDFKTRHIALDKVLWDKDGWPYFKDGHPCKTSVFPTF